MSAPRDFTVTLAAGATHHVRARGRFIGILAAPAGSLQLSIDGGLAQTRGAGGTVWVERGFTRIDITSAFAQEIRVVIADQAQAIPAGGGSGSSGAGGGPFNTLPAGGDVSIPATSTQVLAAADATRVGIVITNPITNTREVRIGGAAVGAASGVRLEPGDSITLDTLAAVSGYNPHSSAQSVNVLPLQNV